MYSNISYDLIGEVKKMTGLEYEPEIRKDELWVSDALKEEAKEWIPEKATPHGIPPQPVLINAPTGSGKTFFVLNYLAQLAKENNKKILILSNRDALCLQMRRDADEASEIIPLGMNVQSDYPTSDNRVILKYQQITPYENYREGPNPYETAFVVFDEVHFFNSDSTFNATTSLILRKLIHQYYRCKRIYLSATVDEAKPIISHEEFFVQNRVNDERAQRKLFSVSSKISQYFFPASYDKVNLHFFHRWESIVDSIIDNEQKEKWLILVKSKEDGENLKKQLGDNAKFIDATYRSKKESEYHAMLSSRRFTSTVLIATSVIYNGVGFLDPRLKHIVIDSVDETFVKQALGRKRCESGETVNLYLRVPTEKDVIAGMKYTNELYESVKEFKSNPLNFIAQKWGTGELNERLQKLIQPVFISYPAYGNFPTLSYQVSDYAAYQLGLEYRNYERLVNRIDDLVFEKTACKWFDKNFVTSMEFDDTLEELKEKTTQQLLECFYTYSKESDLSTTQREELWTKLREIVDPLKNEVPVTIRHKLGKNDSRLNADIKRIFEAFGMPYCITKNEKKNILSVEEKTTTSEE